jgi:flavorubredoxin
LPHWPKPCDLLEEDRFFSCDFFGSHIASSDLFVTDQGRVHEAAKRYFAEIMMPFRNVIEKNIEKLAPYDIQMIAPSHGQMYDRSAWIIDAYRDWVTNTPHNLVTFPFVCTQHPADGRLSTAAPTERQDRVELFNLPSPISANLRCRLWMREPSSSGPPLF